MASESKGLSPYRLLTEEILPEGEFAPPGRVVFTDGHVHLRDYWRVLVKYRRLIFAVFFVVVASTAIVVFTMSPRYTATATLQIDRRSPKVAPVQEVQQADSTYEGTDQHDYYQTQYDILGSRTLSANVIKSLGLESDARFTEAGELEGLTSWIFSRVGSWFGGHESQSDDEGAEANGVSHKAIERYSKKLIVEPMRNSRLVKISFTSYHADLSAQVANQHVDQYIKRDLESRLAVTLNAKEFLENELAKAKDRVDAAEVALNKFRKEKGVIGLDNDKSDIVTARLDDLNKRFTEAQADRIKLQGQYDLIQHRDYQSLPDVVANPLLQSLKQNLAKAEEERAELAKKFTPLYPKMAETIARAAETKARLDTEIRNIVASIESAYLAAKNREADLGVQLETQRQAALQQKDVGADYDTLKRDVDTARSLYANLLTRLKDVDVAGEIRTSNISVVDWAEPPTRPSSPRKLLYLAIAWFGGLFCGVGLALFLEYLDNTVRTPEDVERAIRLPTLGVVPSFELTHLADGSIGHANGHRRGHAAASHGNGSGYPQAAELVVYQQPLSVISEAYRTIRTAILLSSVDKPPHVMLFTSSLAGEGKTVTAINQAITLVLAGGRVLMIDADIRKPRLHTIFKIPNAHGLSSCLAAQSPLESVIHEVSLNGRNGNGASHPQPEIAGRLFVLPAGPMPPNPAELLGSRRMRELIESLRGRYDYILVDTPPVLPVTDAVVLATVCEGVVFVVRGQETPVPSVRKARERLDRVGANILGVVLNDVDVTNGDYENYDSYFYRYELTPDSV